MKIIMQYYSGVSFSSKDPFGSLSPFQKKKIYIYIFLNAYNTIQTIKNEINYT